MPVIRSFVMLIVACALFLAVGPGPCADAAGMDTTFSAQQDPDGCDLTMAPHGPVEKHDAGGCGKMQCCLGAICVLAGLPGSSLLVIQPSAVPLTVSAQTVFLTGRDVAPPLDPPRPVA